MAKSIQISDVEIPILADFYRKRIEEKRVELRALESTLTSLVGGEAATYSDQMLAPIIVSNNGYLSNWTWVKKIDFILGTSKLTTSEIVAKVLEYEPNLVPERAKIVGSISAVLSVKSRNNEYYTKEINARGENLFGLLGKQKTVEESTVQ